MLSRFSPIPIDSHETLHLHAFGWGGNKVFIFVTRSMSFRYLLKTIKLVSYSYRTMIFISLMVRKNQLYCEALTVCVLFLRRFVKDTHIFTKKIL